MKHTSYSTPFLPVNRDVKRRAFKAVNIVVQLAVILSLGSQGGFGAFVPTAKAVTTSLTTTILSWNILGVDSNNPVTDGPHKFLIQARIKNTGAAPATGVQSTFAFGAGTSYLSLVSAAAFPLNTIAAGASKDVFYVVQVTPPASPNSPSNDVFDKTRPFTITTTSPDASNSSATQTLTIEHILSQSRNHILSSTVTPPNPLVGQPFTVHVEYETSSTYLDITPQMTYNPAVATLDSVLTTYADGTESDIYAVNEGNAVGSDFHFRAQSAGTLNFFYTVLDHSGSSYHYNSDSSNAIIVPVTPRQNLTKTVNKATANPGDSLTYTLSYFNTGNIDLTNVVITETYNSHFTFGSAVPSPSSGNNVWNIGNLPVAAGGTITINGTITGSFSQGSTTVHNVAVMTSTQTGPVTATADTSVSASCVLSITKSVDKATANPGDLLTYTLNYQNTGTADCTGGGVRINDTVTAGITYNGTHTQSAGTDFGYADALFGAANPTGYLSGSRLLSWNANVLTPGESGTVTWKATVNTPQQCGAFDIPNFAKIYSDQVTAGVTSNTVHTTGSTPCAGTLTVIKHVVNDNGGTKVAGDFTMHVSNGTPANFAGSESGTIVTIPAGQSFAVTEDAVTGYAGSNTGTCSGAMTAGASLTCTVTNNDVTASITLVKSVTNNSGGTAGANDFGLTIGGTSVSSGDTLSVNSNTPIALNEAGLTGYSFTSLTGDAKCPQILGGTATLNEGEHITCTITNDDQPGTLHVVKVLPNDNGGTATPEEFSFSMNGGNAIGFEVDGQNDLTVNAGTYSVVETNPQAGYTVSYDKCTSVVIPNGGEATCTITNDDLTAHLTVVKHVVNVGGSDAIASDFTLIVNGTNVSDGQFPGDENGTTVSLDAGSYSVSESSVTGWTTVFSEECSGTIANDGTATCTVTNTRDSGTINGTKFVDANGNGEWDQDEPVYAGVTIHLSNGWTTTTGIDGTYTFENVPTGTYTVSEDIPAGWTATTPNLVSDVSVTKDQIVTVNFGNFELGSISGYKFNDLNGNGEWNEGEPGLNGWEICLNGSENCQITHNDGGENPGFYEFSGLHAGSYDVYEHQQEGWISTTPKNGEFEDLVIQSGTDLTHQDFGNFRLGRIEGFKFDAQENPLAGWTICIDFSEGSHQCTQTDENGHYAFTGLLADSYTVSEQNQFGWTQLSPESGTYTVPVTSGTGTGEEHSNYNFVNRLNAFDVSIEKTGAASVEAGSTLTYTLHWSVSGNIPVVNTIVTDELPANTTFVAASDPGTFDGDSNTVTWNLGAKNSGDSGDVTLTVSIATPLPNGTRIANTGQVCADGELVGNFEVPHNTTKCDTDTTTTTVESAPTLTIVKTDSPDPVAAGANLTYTLAWTVGGNAVATNVVITDPLPANTTFVSADNGGTYDSNSNTVTWNLGTQTPPALGSVTLVVKVASPLPNGTVLNNAGTICGVNSGAEQEDIASPTLCETDTETTTVASAPILTITKVNDVTTFVNPGATVNYTVTVTNSASATDTAHNVSVTDVLPAGFTYVSSGTSTKTFVLGELAPGASVTTSYAAFVSANQTAGLYTNTATASASNASPVSASSNVDVRVAQVLPAIAVATLAITKTADVPFAGPDTTVTYTVTVKNVGEATAVNVVLHDTLPAGFTYVIGGGQEKTWNLGNLEPGTSRVINYQVRLSSHLKAGKYTNVAEAKADNTPKVSARLTLPVKVGQVLGLATTGAGRSDLLFALAGALLILFGALGLRRTRFVENA